MGYVLALVAGSELSGGVEQFCRGPQDPGYVREAPRSMEKPKGYFPPPGTPLTLRSQRGGRPHRRCTELGKPLGSDA